MCKYSYVIIFIQTTIVVYIDNFTALINVSYQNKGLVIKNKIKNLKQRIENNYEKLYKKFGNNCQLSLPVLETINILLKAKDTDDQIKYYLDSINSAIVIIEEKLATVEEKDNLKV